MGTGMDILMTLALLACAAVVMVRVPWRPRQDYQRALPRRGEARR